VAGDPNARAIGHAGGDADVDHTRVTIVRQWEPADRSPRGILERQLDFVFDVAPSHIAWAAAGPPVRVAGVAEERAEEIRI
jgi:hypothetical protein